MSAALRLCLLGCLVALPGTAAAQSSTPAKVVGLSADPAEVVLTHANDRQQLLVSAQLADRTEHDSTHGVQYTAADPAVVSVSPQGVVRVKGVGQTVIHVSGHGFKASVPVRVTAAAERPVSFANDVMP